MDLEKSIKLAFKEYFGVRDFKDYSLKNLRLFISIEKLLIKEGFQEPIELDSPEKKRVCYEKSLGFTDVLNSEKSRQAFAQLYLYKLNESFVKEGLPYDDKRECLEKTIQFFTSMGIIESDIAKKFTRGIKPQIFLNKAKEHFELALNKVENPLKELGDISKELGKYLPAILNGLYSAYFGECTYYLPSEEGIKKLKEEARPVLLKLYDVLNKRFREKSERYEKHTEKYGDMASKSGLELSKILGGDTEILDLAIRCKRNEKEISDKGECINRDLAMMYFEKVKILEEGMGKINSLIDTLLLGEKGLEKGQYETNDWSFNKHKRFMKYVIEYAENYRSNYHINSSMARINKIL